MHLRLVNRQNQLLLRLIFFVALAQTCGLSESQIMRTPSSQATHVKSTLKWPKPSQLKRELQWFESDPTTAAWAIQTGDLVEYLCVETEVTQPDAVSVLMAIKKQSEAIPGLIAKLNQRFAEDSRSGTIEESLIPELQRFQYRLSRRIQVWASVIDHANSRIVRDPDSQIKTVSLNRLPRDLDALEEGWQEYLAWDQLVAAAQNSNRDKKTNRTLRLASQKFLARYYSPSLTEQQREKFQPMFSPLIIDSVRQSATGEVNASNLMNLVELLEKEDSGKYMKFLNAEYQKLLWSQDPVEQEMASILDSHWRNANVRIAVNEELLNQLLPQMPATTEPISDRVLGAKVSGQSMIENQLRIGLIPNPDEISLGLETTGQVTADTVAKRSGFAFQNRGFANFQVFKKLAFSRSGVTAEESHASSTADQKVVGLIRGSYDKVPIVGWLTRKIARKKAEESAPEAERIFKDLVESDAKKRVEQEVGQLVYRLRSDLHEHVLSRLISMDLEPETVQLSTTEQRIVGRFRIAGRDQMAAYQPRPIDDESDLLTVQFHHSAINNLINRFELNGNEFNATTLGKRIEEVAGIPYQAARGEDEATFEFSKHDAVRVDFADGIVSLKFGFTKFQIGKGKRWRNISVTAKFKPTYIGTRVVLDLLEVKPDSKKKLRVGDHIAIIGAFKAILERQYAFDLMPNAVRETMPQFTFAIESLSLAEGWCGVVFENASDINRQVPIVAPDEVVPGTWSDQLGAFQPKSAKVEMPRTARRIGSESSNTEHR